LGLKTFAELSADLKTELGEWSPDTEKYGDWINDAYLTITTMRYFLDRNGRRRSVYFPELGDMSSEAVDSDNTHSYISVPSSAFIIEAVHDYTNDVKLTRLTSWREYIGKTGRFDSDSTAPATHYIRRGTYIYLYPTPDDSDTYYIYYRRRPEKLVGSTTPTIIGAEWDYPIVKLAKLQSLLRLKDYESYKFEKEEYQELMMERIGAYDDEKLDREDSLAPNSSYTDRDNY
jgi:hypothetical protein